MILPTGAGQLAGASAKTGPANAGHGHGQGNNVSGFGDLLKKLLQAQGAAAVGQGQGATPPAAAGQSTAAVKGVASLLNVGT